MNIHFAGANGPDFTKTTSHTDSEKLTLADTTITIISTPGGASLIILVTDNITKYMVGMCGETGLPQSLEYTEKYLNPLNYFFKFIDTYRKCCTDY